MAMNPLPSLIRASALDAANRQMRAAGRTKWSVDDWNMAAETQDRLITGCYGRDGDNDPRMKFIRFQIAEGMERRGEFTLSSDATDVMARINDTIYAGAAG